MKHRRFLARLALICIALLLCAVLILAFCDLPGAQSWLMAALFCLIVIPVVIYAFLMFTKKNEDQKP